MFQAIETVGRLTLLTRGTKVLGRVHTGGMCRAEVVILLTPELYEQLIAPVVVKRDYGYPPEKVTFLRFSPYTGEYMSNNLDDDGDIKAVDGVFDNCRVVDEFNFGWGLVPEVFREVEGYRERMNALTEPGE